MITYTYKCNNEECEEFYIPFEVQQNIKDDKLTTCWECGKESLSKVITSAGGFRIGGLGVYKPTTHWGG